MSVTLRPITAENWRACIALAPSSEQQRFVAPNLWSLAEAKVRPEMQSYGIYADDAMVGFAMYGRDPGDGRYRIVRLMVDASHQGKRYGRAATEAIIARLMPFCDEILLDYHEENSVARRLAASLGFEEIERDGGAVVASLAIAPLRAARRAKIPTVTIIDEVNDEGRAYLQQEIRAFNDSHSAPHRMANQPERSPKPLHLFLKDADGTVFGGLTGQTVWGWLEIDYLWVDERLRGRDYGTELMRRAEAEAKRRGSTRAVVGTFSFQARGFYEKLGYRIVGALVDHPPGEADYWLRKDFLDGAE
jgi:ribosomal protein S18 acetylase RimI-like enzyme